MNKLLLTLLILTLSTYHSYAKDKSLKSGIWQTELKLSDTQVLPFNFYYSKSEQKITIFNASEKIDLTDITIKGNQINIKFPIFNSELIGTITSKKVIVGYWHNYAKGKDYKIPFKSVYNENLRFKDLQNKAEQVEGKWEVTFDYSDSKEKSIGLFNIVNNKIHATFLTETGDYRFLEGVFHDNQLNLSCFDGSHAFLFNATLKNDTLWGEFLSGTHYKTNWFAVKNKNFELRDPEKLTYLINNDPITFNLQGLNGSNYTYPNNTTKNKVVLIQILGTWCPNCMDETNYLTDLYAKYSNDIEIIGVGFETGETQADKLNTLLKYKTHMAVNYNLVVGGSACKPCAVELFPMLNDVMSFPTLIIIDKKGEIRKIHTGFSGPSTGQYYTEFVKHTTQFIETLIKE